MNLIGIKAPKGLYLSDNVLSKDYHQGYLGGKDRVNGHELVHTFHKDWWLAEGAETVETFTEVRKQPRINHRFVLVDESMASDKIPSVISGDGLVYHDYEWILVAEYAHLQSLYRLESDEQPDVEVPVEFSLAIVLELEEDLVDYGQFKYPRVKQWDKPQFYVTNEDVHYRILDRIVFPTLVLPSRPCRLTSGESYDIVREHVKRHIDSKVATISSDYDFCFAVEKVIRLAKPYSYKKEILTARGKSYRKRRYRDVYVSGRKMKVFEMTWAGAKHRGSDLGYGDYTVIKGFEGENEQDLREKIDAYLEELMEIINAPLVDCPHCNGMGVLWDEKVAPTNPEGSS